MKWLLIFRTFANKCICIAIYFFRPRMASVIRTFIHTIIWLRIDWKLSFDLVSILDFHVTRDQLLAGLPTFILLIILEAIDCSRLIVHVVRVVWQGSLTAITNRIYTTNHPLRSLVDALCQVTLHDDHLLCELLVLLLQELDLPCQLLHHSIGAFRLFGIWRF